MATQIDGAPVVVETVISWSDTETYAFATAAAMASWAPAVCPRN